jgi:S1-C subfamily serine protease
MPRYSPLLALLLFLVPPAVLADEKTRLKDIQEAMEQVIEKAEPSIACVLVSRSEGYADFGAAPSSEIPGKLGTFDTRQLLTSGPKEQNEKTRKRILSLDLSHPDHQPEAYGSGVVIDESGLILTNAHVVRGATKLYVRLPGNRGSYADIYALDPRCDMAVLKLIDKVSDLKALKLGDGGKVRKGQFVVTLANPFAAGFRDGSPSASWGIVSNMRRRAPGPANELDRAKVTLHHYGTLIQTDARLTLGCSGGALLNLDGELIGMTTAQAALVGSETPGGFAVPFDEGTKRIIEVLRRGEEVEYGFLGVELQPATRTSKGVQIARVIGGSPAQRAGLNGNEYIVSVEGQAVHENDDLFLYAGMHLAGTSIKMETAARADGTGERHTVIIELAKYYVPGPIIVSKKSPVYAGLRVDYSSILSQRPVPFGFREIPRGVLIREVVSNSPADQAHLQSDKVISRVNGSEVKTPQEFYQKMEAATGKIKLTLINPDGHEDEVTLDKK